MNRFQLFTLSALALALSPAGAQTVPLDFGLGEPIEVAPDVPRPKAAPQAPVEDLEEIDFGLGETTDAPAPMPEPEPKPVPSKPAVSPPPSAAEISGLLSALADDDYGTRLNAQSKILEFGISHPETILDKLADPFLSATDTDMRLQLRMLIWNTIRFDLNDRPIGFVGIQMSDSSIFEGQGKVRRTVQVLQVIPDTAAARNDIRFGDHIVEFNGKNFDAGRPSVMFQNYIQQLTVGDSVKLKINRSGKDMELDIDLGERPINLAGTANPEIERLKARFDQYVEDEKQKRGLISDEPDPLIAPFERGTE